ncbi:MAG: hypothetical protein GX066_04425 [Clostridiaceae bacterium]|nr:hypothetical protein [Clostridiaceae bacterium]
MSLIVIFIIGEVFLPMPQYYIKHEGSKKLNLNEVLEEETLRAGIEFDEGSFKILDSYGMHFNHLFLCSYEIDGKEEACFFHFEKNIFGNMKPRYPLKEINIITGRNNQDDYYRSYVEDGIFAEYLVTVGLGVDSSTSINFESNKYRISKTPQEGYFMWVEMIREPWKSYLVMLILYAGIIFIISRYQNNKIEPVKFYSKWKKGDKIFTCTKNVNP